MLENILKVSSLTKFLILIISLLVAFGQCAPREKGQSESEVYAALTEVSPQDYYRNREGAGAIAVGADGYCNPCVGVMTSKTQFTTSCILDGLGWVFVGSRYSPLQKEFDGQILNVTSGPVYKRSDKYFTWTVTPIPEGSMAVPAPIYPRGTPPPGKDAECFAVGYGGTVAPAKINTLKAKVTDMTSCNETYPGMEEGEHFCATVTRCGDPGLGSLTVLFCRPWVTRKEKSGPTSPSGDRRTPYAFYVEEEATDSSWYLAGFEVVDLNNCLEEGSLLPTIFRFVVKN